MRSRQLVKNPRLRGVAFLVLVVAAVLVAALAAWSMRSRQTGFPAPSVRYRVVTVPWQLETSKDGLVTLRYAPPRCAAGPAQATVRETEHWVEISLSVLTIVGRPCPPAPASARLDVVLSSPLGPRPLRDAGG